MMKQILRALRYRNYRLFFLGQSVSLIGTWMQNIAMAWLVYRLTKSPFLLGVVGFSSQIPAFILTPFAGVLADRYNRHRILVITQSLAMLQAFVLSFFVLTNTPAVWLIVLLSMVLGMVNAFDMPARQSFVVDMVEKKEDLGNAIALNSSMVNGARLLGPSIAGIIIAAAGEGICFLLNGISYIAVIISLLAMKIKPIKLRENKNHILYEIKEGMAYAYRFVPIRDLILLLSLVSLVGMSYVVLMPIFAKDILAGGPQTMGFLMAASGIGALIGGFYLASRKSVLGLGRMVPSAIGLFGLGLIAFSFSRLLWLSIFLIMLVGFGMMVAMAATNTLLQTIVEDDKRGRVMSLFMMAFVGMAPFGSLLAGGMANLIGAPPTILISGVFCVIGSFIFYRRLPMIKKYIHPVYVKMGIIPQIAEGMKTATELTVPPEE